MFEYLTKTDIVNLKEFILNSINYLRWESGLKFEVAITDRGKLNFDKYLLHFESYSQSDNCKY